MEMYDNVYVPSVYNDLTSTRVLGMEWINGARVTDNDAIEKFGFSYPWKSSKAYKLQLCDRYRKSFDGLFCYNFFSYKRKGSKNFVFKGKKPGRKVSNSIKPKASISVVRLYDGTKNILFIPLILHIFSIIYKS